MLKRLICLMVGFMLIMGVSSCAPKQKKLVQVEPTADEPDIRSGEYESAAELPAVYFDYDKANIRSDAKLTLNENAGYLKKNKNLELLVEGHCDERSTLEYNIALGQRRAAAVRKYLSSLGVSQGRISTISYGEERPADHGHTEAAWAKNRRAEFKIREAASTPSSE